MGVRKRRHPDGCLFYFEIEDQKSIADTGNESAEMERKKQAAHLLSLS